VTAQDLGSAAARERGQSAPSGTLLPLTFGLTGRGTLYYTAELRYAMLASGVDPRDEGIGIATEILDDKGTIVAGSDLALGKVYTMKVVFYSSRDRTYLALRAPIPSGAEPIEPGAAVYRLLWGEREIALVPGENPIGRERGSIVWIDDFDVSRNHARIVIDGSGARIEDLGSKNGTFHRGEKIIAATALADGDIVRVGGATMVFRVFLRTGPTATAASTRLRSS